ncbi:TIR domain-containing protein [Chitinophaga sp. SYP-B3965]|uniref:TIR domain-containing protein n=1 Tax=Chitinophaga sp. SYP-B3965 TaxID=2663120 RepID=UPI001299EDF2|nr:TIR domain-containing protein [Chitinophaga sp. SYP-B3965]MRG44064.1 TIR domain-containing protein [Chitinophaga sp. SYP-B3965]
MKIFISWSGLLSKELAEVLKNWIPKVIQAAKPFYSPDDISKGSRWNNDITKELEDTKVGLFCLTQDNLESPWIMFEAGALSKNVESSKVCPILFNVEPSQIVGPLIQFQAATKFARDEIYKTVSMLNDELGENKLKTADLNEQFEMWWPRLKENVERILFATKPTVKTTKRSTDDILEEILQLTRTASINRTSGINELGGIKSENLSPVSRLVAEELAKAFEGLFEVSIELNNEAFFRKLKRLLIPVEYIVKNSLMSVEDKEARLTKLLRNSDRINFEINKRAMELLSAELIRKKIDGDVN